MFARDPARRAAVAAHRPARTRTRALDLSLRCPSGRVPNLLVFSQSRETVSLTRLLLSPTYPHVPDGWRPVPLLAFHSTSPVSLQAAGPNVGVPKAAGTI